MPRPKANLVVLDPGSGKARPGAFVTIYNANTLDKAALYADDDLAPVGNPVQANGLGQVAVRLNPGLYDVSMTWDGALPTVVEDVGVFTSEAVIVAPGDLIIGGAAGTPVRLAVGANGQVLVVENGLPAWKALGPGVGLPAGTAGSLLAYGAGGSLTTILPGLQDQALAMAGGVPTWVSTLLPPGTTLPINQPGDLVVGAVTTGLPARLAVGTVGSTLTVSDNNALVWSEPGGVGSGTGQCYLAYENDQSLWLTPFRGNKIWVNGQTRTIPDTGIRLTPTGLSLDTNYYIYLAWTGTDLALEASTTGFQQTTGLTHKAGDLSRTLVGYARLVGPTPGHWEDSEGSRCVLSFFNQDERTGTGYLRAPRSLGSQPNTPVEVHPEIRCYFIAWGFTNITMTLTGSVYSTATFPIAIISFLALDGVAISGTQTSAMQGGPRINIATGITKTLAAQDTLHFLSLYGLTQTGGSATWEGEASGVTSCRVAFTIAT